MADGDVMVMEKGELWWEEKERLRVEKAFHLKLGETMAFHLRVEKERERRMLEKELRKQILGKVWGKRKLEKE